MTDEQRRLRWLALARVPGAVAAGIAHHLSRAGGKGEGLAEAFEGGAPEWLDVVGEAKSRLDQAEREIAAAAKAGARLVDIEDVEYPALLRGILDPPPVLFVRGVLVPRDERMCAVIGSREATRYGVSITRQLVPPLAAKGVTIVSGMARGIDSAAHRSALDGGGRTIAVLGTGIDVCYPTTSRDLYLEIPKHGAIVSEVAPGTQAAPWVFPPRNRIISGISKTIVIVEARLRSGTSVTARYALDQGRELGVVPGDVDIARSAGTNAFLSQGAFAVRDAEDVLCFGFGEVRGVRPDAPRPVPPGLDPPSLSIWYALDRAGPSSIDALIVETELGATAAMTAIGKLERAGIVQGDGWGRYALQHAVSSR